MSRGRKKQALVIWPSVGFTKRIKHRRIKDIMKREVKTTEGKMQINKINIIKETLLEAFAQN